MSKPFVPPAPIASWEKAEKISPRQPALQSGSARALAPLDAAFIGRVFRSIAWFGALSAFLVYGALNSVVFALSFASGTALGALLLKSQEILVRRILRPKDAPAYDGWDKKIPLWVLLPAKYLLVVLALGSGIRSGWINPISLAFGFIAVQLVITAKVVGYVLAARVRSVREVYVDQNS